MLELLVVRWGYLAVVLGTILEGETILAAAGAMALVVALVAATAWRGVQRRLHPKT